MYPINSWLNKKSYITFAIVVNWDKEPFDDNTNPDICAVTPS
jgi:hypothetical protein